MVAITEAQEYLVLGWLLMSSVGSQHSPIRYSHNKRQLLIHEDVDVLKHGIRDWPNHNHLAEPFHNADGSDADKRNRGEESCRPCCPQEFAVGCEDRHTNDARDEDHLCACQEASVGSSGVPYKYCHPRSSRLSWSALINRTGTAPYSL